MLNVHEFPHLKDPRVGMLVREGKPIYYAHIDGEFPERDTVDEIIDLLEGRLSPPASHDLSPGAFAYAPSILPDLYANEGVSVRGSTKDFTVKIVNVDIPWMAPGYFVVRARSKRAAISRAREEMRSPSINHTRREGKLVYTIVDED